MKLLYLYTEVMGYTLATIRELINIGHEVILIHWDHKKLTPFYFNNEDGLTVYKRSEHNYRSINRITSRLRPEIIIVSGWQDKTYMRICAKHRQSSEIVCCLDDQWHGQIHQYIGSALGFLGVFKVFYSKAWVSGVYQYEYARRIGFKKRDVIFNLYSADLDVFFPENHISQDKRRSLLYVGRLEPIKGIEVLLSAWERVQKYNTDWTLNIVGDGSLKVALKQSPNVIHHGFVQPKDLNKHIQQAAFVILPSVREPWGVVMHEFVATGKPIIATTVVGSRSEFLIDGYNGFMYNPENSNELEKVLIRLFCLSFEEITKMGQRSINLSQRITPETSAYNLLSILGEDKYTHNNK